MNLFLFGEMRIGKTTIINKIIDSKKFDIQGFKTFQGPLNNEGFHDIYIQDINKQAIYEYNYLVAKRNVSQSNIIKYPETFENKGVEILNNIVITKNSLVIFDEIGFIEDECYLFQEKIINLLDSKVNILGVLKKKDARFINEIKLRQDIIFLEVDLENRNYLHESIFKILYKII